MYYTGINFFLPTTGYVCIHYRICHKWSTSQSTQISQKRDRRNIYPTMVTNRAHYFHDCIYIYIDKYIYIAYIYIHTYILHTHIYIYIYICIMTFNGKLVNLYIWFTISSCYSSIPLTLGLIRRNCVLSNLCQVCRFACQQRVLKPFPGPNYLRSEDGVV